MCFEFNTLMFVCGAGDTAQLASGSNSATHGDAGSDVRAQVLAIFFLLNSWSLLASESESSSASRDSENFIHFRVELSRQQSSYLQIDGEIISPTRRQSSAIREGCEPLELKGILARGTGREFVATEWLRKNALKCSETDLKYIANNLHKWSEFAMYDAIRLANYYVQQVQDPE